MKNRIYGAFLHFGEFWSKIKHRKEAKMNSSKCEKEYSNRKLPGIKRRGKH